ncbi:MAG TPA: DTW domain-containing protein, partial [Myxococcales bacterium]|nr:DTW domain-containing protein [Myxococcales bacterium]
MDARPHCYACDKVASHCICARVDGVDNRTAITLVQHPRERRHPFGTARIARLGLSNFAMHVLEPDDPLDVPRDAAVLFPDPGAPSLTELPPSRRPRHLVVIDGTWAHASQLRRNHPSLAPLSAVTLPPGPPSRYRIRREPSDEAISTIEAIVRALRVLEPETRGVDGLLDTFDAMIDDQLETRSA